MDKDSSVVVTEVKLAVIRPPTLVDTAINTRLELFKARAAWSKMTQDERLQLIDEAVSVCGEALIRAIKTGPFDFGRAIATLDLLSQVSRTASDSAQLGELVDAHNTGSKTS
jgi:hypothetical protein